MPLTMTYDQWMKDTHSFTKPRSETLKAIDAAIKIRNAVTAKNALIKWIDEQNRKHQDWQRSVRNEKGAVKKLYDQLGVLGAAPVFGNNVAAQADKEGKEYIKEQQRLATLNLFTGKNVKFKDSFWGICRTNCQGAKQKIDKTGTAAGMGAKGAALGMELASIANDLKTVITTLMGEVAPELQKQILTTVFNSTIENFVTSAAPFLGMGSSGVKAVKAWVAVARQLSAFEDMYDRRGDIRLGDPAAALQAISAILDREISSQKRQAGVRTAAFAAKGVFTLTDFGTASTAAVGAAESIAMLLNTLAEVVRDARETQNGNKLIRDNKIDLNLFKTCPILGAYYIVIQDHSTVMNFDIENMGRTNWQQEAERLKYAIKPVIEKARELIKVSRIEIQGLENAKGVYESTMLQKISLHFKSKGHGQNSNMDAIQGFYGMQRQGRMP